MCSTSKEVEGSITQKLFKALSTKAQTLEEIVSRTDMRLSTAKPIITRLVNKGMVMAIGERPVKYKLYDTQEERAPKQREDWTGFPMPYTRPGSYTEPRTKVSMISKARLYNINIDL